MNDLLELEAMGYRFSLTKDGQVRYQRYGPEPPPRAATLLARLNREHAKQILQDRQKGFITVAPQEICAPWSKRYEYMQAVKQALDEGVLFDVQVIYVRQTREWIYWIIPADADLTEYLVRAGAIPEAADAAALSG